MPFIDRTQEFFKIVDARRHQNGFEESRPSAKKEKQLKKQDTNKSLKNEFYDRASHLSLELQQSATNLQKLTKLVKKKTPFDGGEDIHHLTVLIKESLATHQLSLKELRGMLTKQQQEQDLQQQAKHSSTIISSLDSKLLFTAELFQNVLKSRTKQITKESERRKMYISDKPVFQQHRAVVSSPMSPPTSSNPSSTQRNPRPHVEHQNGEVVLSFGPPASNSKGKAPANSYNNGDLLPMTVSGHQQMELMEPQQQKQEQLQQVADRTDSYLKQRSHELQEIEIEINSLSSMFQDLATMVRQQGELTMSIEKNIDTAGFHVEEAQNEIMKYMKRIMGNRGLILKIFVVLIIFVIIAGFIMR